jgi:hypothetical protein
MHTHLKRISGLIGLSERRLCVGFFFISAALNLAFSMIGLRNSLIEVHEFRQIQTALNARGLLEEGWKLAYPAPLFGPPWSVPMEFPLYQYLSAKLCATTGLPLEVSGRLVALGFLYLALPACFGLAGCLGLPRNRQWLAPALVLLTPVYLYYSRSFMIESTALCASLWFLFGYIRSVESGSRRWLVVAVICGMVAAVVKVTTAAVYLTVAAVYTVWLLQVRWRSRTRGTLRLIARALLATLPALAAGTAWVVFSDRVKASNPLSAHLVAEQMREFNLGTLAQRFTTDFWQRMADNTSNVLSLVLNFGLLLVFGVLLGTGQRQRLLLLLVGFFAGPLLFANLYFVHDYYYYANGVFLLGALVLAWNQILNLHQFSYTARWTVILASAAAQLCVYLPSYFQVQRQNLGPIPELATLLADATRPDDVVLIFGQDWAARVPYYAHRRAVMIRDNQANYPEAIVAVLDRIEPGRVTALVASGPFRANPIPLHPYIKRLGMRPDPILINQETVVYLTESRITEALTNFQSAPPRNFEFGAPSADASSSIPRLRGVVGNIRDRSLFSMMSPEPTEILYPFGLAVHNVETGKAFNAHAPTDIIFGIPDGAKEVFTSFGILKEAFTGNNVTQGVEFRVELVKPEGVREVLQTVYLSPSTRSEDAGTKELSILLPSDAAGQLWFRTLPGPSGSIAYTWAYWAKIEIR